MATLFDYFKIARQQEQEEQTKRKCIEFYESTIQKTAKKRNGYWMGIHGLERAKKLVLGFYYKYNKIPVYQTKGFNGIIGLARPRRNSWNNTSITSWNTFIEYCGLKPYNYRGRPIKSTITYVYSNLTRNAKNRKIECNLTFEDVEKLDVFQSCVYCKDEPTKGKRKGILPYNSIDRIDSKKGYILDNIQILCRDCQQIKWNFSLEEIANKIGQKMINMVRIAKEQQNNEESENGTQL